MRLKHVETGVVVVVDEATAATLSPEWKPVGGHSDDTTGGEKRQHKKRAQS